MNLLGTFTTRSGQAVSLRLIRQEDTALLVDLFYHLSPESRRLRFHIYATKLPAELVWEEAEALSNLDPRRQVGIVGTYKARDDQEHAVGVARFARAEEEDTEAEVAIVVRDDFQRQGLGKHMLNLLTERARELGILYFTAWILADNIGMMRLLKGLDLKKYESETHQGETLIRVPI